MKVNLEILNLKLELIEWISSIEDPAILEKIMELRKKESNEWWCSISESEKESIELGLKDAEAGKLNPHSKAKELYEKWL